MLIRQRMTRRISISSVYIHLKSGEKSGQASILIVNTRSEFSVSRPEIHRRSAHPAHATGLIV